jgi:transposase
MVRRHGLRDNQWERIQDLLPGRAGHVGVTAKDNRLFVDAVLYRYRAGLPWRDLPERYGPWKAVHTRWAKSGVWATLFQHLAEDADTEYAMIDSTIVRAHQHSAGAKGGIASRRRLGAARVGCRPRSTPPPMPWATQRASISRPGRSTIWSVPTPCCQAWRLALSLPTKLTMPTSG